MAYKDKTEFASDRGDGSITQILGDHGNITARKFWSDEVYTQCEKLQPDVIIPDSLSYSFSPSSELLMRFTPISFQSLLEYCQDSRRLKVVAADFVPSQLKMDMNSYPKWTDYEHIKDSYHSSYLYEQGIYMIIFVLLTAGSIKMDRRSFMKYLGVGFTFAEIALLARGYLGSWALRKASESEDPKLNDLYAKVMNASRSFLFSAPIWELRNIKAGLVAQEVKGDDSRVAVIWGYGHGTVIPSNSTKQT